MILYAGLTESEAHVWIGLDVWGCRDVLLMQFLI